MRLVSTLLATAVVASGCAPAPRSDAPPTAPMTGEDRVCFRPSEIRNFRSETSQTVYVRTSASDVFQVQASGGCRGLETANAIAMRPQTGAGRICTGDWATLSLPAETCRVQVVKRLSEADLAALPGRLRP